MNKNIKISLPCFFAFATLAAGNAVAADMTSRSSAHNTMSMHGKSSAQRPSGYGKMQKSGNSYGKSYDYRSRGSNSYSRSAPHKADWNGFYLGGNVGYSWAKYTIYPGDDTSDTVKVNLGGIKTKGFTYGGQGGYMFEMDDNIIAGVEGDVIFLSRLGGDDLINHVGDDRAASDEELLFKGSADWVGTVRGRIGSAMDNYMVYGTGGITFSQYETIYLGEDKSRTVVVKSEKITGWALGGGIEFMMTENIISRLEFLYYDLGTDQVEYASKVEQDAFDSGKSIDTNLTLTSVRVGLNLKF